MTRYRSITMASHAWLEGLLQPGDRVLDATAGNGGDTLWLAQQVGASGHVWAFDRQAVALENTQHSLAAAGLLSRVTLVEGNHAQLEHDLPRDAQANLAAIVFNLGYLPGADRGLTTEAASTLHALSVSWEWLRPGGALAVVCYPGHASGSIEADAVRGWFAQQSTATRQTSGLIEVGPTRRPAPFLLTLRRKE